MYSLFATPRSFAPFLLRMTLTAIFVYHGGQEAFGWFGGDGWQRTVEVWTSADGPNLPYLLVVALIVAQLGVSLSLFLGFLTRIAGLVVAIVMVGALMMLESGPSFASLELPLLAMMTGLALAFIGGGRLSLDRAISNNLLPSVG